MQKPNIVIADLDGTIALIAHRRHWLDADRHPELTSDERWRKFFAESVNDQPNWPVIYTLQALQRAGYYIHVFSGRSDEVREQTIDWIEAFDVHYDHLRMRAADDFTPDEELKRQWIEEYDLLKSDG
jgi:phosphoglycolate phosphatase-like HAD superfamily hydrolase